jgi:hypothetical protein
MTDMLAAPTKKFQRRSKALSKKLGEALRDLAKGATPKVKAWAKKERSPSMEIVESGAKATSKSAEESRQQKRAWEEKGSVQKPGKKASERLKPDYKLVSSWEWEKNKQREGTYRYDQKSWKEDARDPWSICGNKVGGLREYGTLYLHIPSVVQVCRKVSGKYQAYKVYVLLPPDAEKGPFFSSTAWPSWRNSATPLVTLPCPCRLPTLRTSTS